MKVYQNQTPRRWLICLISKWRPSKHQSMYWFNLDPINVLPTERNIIFIYLITIINLLWRHYDILLTATPKCILLSVTRFFKEEFFHFQATLHHHFLYQRYISLILMPPPASRVNTIMKYHRPTFDTPWIINFSDIDDVLLINKYFWTISKLEWGDYLFELFQIWNEVSFYKWFNSSLIA